MANPRKRVPENAPGDFFVDSSCIDCDACRQIAPSVFRDAGSNSVVDRQPASSDELLQAQKALLACPTASIGDLGKRNMRAALAAYPELIADRKTLPATFSSTPPASIATPAARSRRRFFAMPARTRSLIASRPAPTSYCRLRRPCWLAPPPRSATSARETCAPRWPRIPS